MTLKKEGNLQLFRTLFTQFKKTQDMFIVCMFAQILLAFN